MRGRALPAIPRAPKSQTGNSLRKEPQWSLPPPPVPPWRSRLQAVGKCHPPLKIGMRCYGDPSPSLTRLPFIYTTYTSLGFKPLFPALGCSHSVSPVLNMHATIVRVLPLEISELGLLLGVRRSVGKLSVPKRKVLTFSS